MRNKKMCKIGISIGMLGVIVLIILLLSGVSHPNIMFRIFAPIGLLLVFIGILIGGIGWILIIKDAVVNKSYKDVIFIFLKGIIIILVPILKIAFSR